MVLNFFGHAVSQNSISLAETRVFQVDVVTVITNETICASSCLTISSNCDK